MVSDRQTFGERLRRHRERRGITLQAISESTKIGSALFAGLERGDCSRWPAGLYSRAYVRAYAETVGLNADETVEDFAALYSAKVHVDGEERPPVRTGSRRGSSTLRLSLAEEPGVAPAQVFKRGALAGADLLIAAAIASAIYVVLDPGVWVILASGLAYQATGRLVTDEPLLSWVYNRTRTAAPREEPEATQDDVAVGSAASTTA